MTTTNDITGDKLKSKPTTDKYRSGYDQIFGNKSKGKEDGSNNHSNGNDNPVLDR